MSDLNTRTATELTGMLSRGECSSVEIVTDVLSAIDRVDGDVKAYLVVNRDEALDDAKVADAARKQGDDRPLLGIPVAIKDLINVKGQSCRCSSKILEGYTSPYDATVVSRLRKSGAIMLGRVNMDEFAMGSSTENSAFGKTRNPWDLDRVPGGSSGGSAAAVAADEAIVALGTDTGGSIRQPAALCGCVGFKPTYGRVSRYGVTAYASSLDQVGPLTKTVEDAALLMSSIAGYDPLDSTSIETPVPNYAGEFRSDLKGMRLGLPKEFFIDGMDSETESTVRAAIKKCEELGAEIVDVSLPHSQYAIAVYYIIATAEASANLARYDGVRYGNRKDGTDPIDMYCNTRHEGFGAEVKRRIILGTYVLSSGYHDAYYLRAQKVRSLIRRDFDEAYSKCDAILTPTTPTPAFKLGEKTDDPLQMYLNDIFTVPVNLAGVCGISVPCGFTTTGLPVGMQIFGPALGESTVLSIAHTYERNSGIEKRRRKSTL